jgi:hypothetical protein
MLPTESTPCGNMSTGDLVFLSLTCWLLKAIAENERKRRQDIDRLLWRWGQREWVDRLFVGAVIQSSRRPTPPQAASSLPDAFLAFQSPCVCAELRFLLAEMRVSIRILQDDVRALQERLENPPVGTSLPFFYLFYSFTMSPNACSIQVPMDRSKGLVTFNQLLTLAKGLPPIFAADLC